ncbi:MAG: hypothetical protein PHI97_01860 [Desulfobulbus sp.]|nr:hypothetical protein [Desulfobulbus sp.]
MYIAAAALSMDASQTYKEVEQRVSGLTSTSNLVSGQSDAFGIRLASMLASSSQTQISCQSEVCRTTSSNTPGELAESGTNQANTTLLAKISEQVIGQSVSIRALQDSLSTTTALRATQQELTPLASLQTVSFTSGTVYSEATSMLFSAQGTVQTLDGREISFDLGLSMEQNTVAVETASFAATGLFIDPLILQFDLDSPLLSDSSFQFDINSDGEMEELACPGSGCGFLAFDRNGDGRINDGSELFGPESGSGFGELAELDSDANFWIDENDPIFDQLMIWTQDGQGGENLCSLKEAGVGAIAVTHAGTDFQLRNDDASVVGTVAANGLFLTEDGEVRPMQEVDLALKGSQTGDAATTSASGFGFLGNRPESQALHVLRDIIGMQRLRLKMMLSGKRLHGGSLAEKSQHKLFFDWLHSHQQWQDSLDQQLVKQQTSESDDQNQPLTS